MSVRRHCQLLSFHRVGENRGSPRLWLESRRLETLGFSVGMGFVVEAHPRRCTPAGFGKQANFMWQSAEPLADVRPIIDVVNRALARAADKMGRGEGRRLRRAH